MLSRFLNFSGKLRRSVFYQANLHVIERDLSLPHGEGDPRIPVEWREGTAADIDGFTEEGLRYNAERKRASHQSFQAGDRFLVGVHNSQVVHVAWVGYREIAFRSFSLKLGPSWAYLYDTRTDDRFRGNRIHGKGIREVMRMAQRAGAARAVACVDEQNVISLKNYEREGFRIVATIRVRRAFRRWARASVPEWLPQRLLSDARTAGSVRAGTGPGVSAGK